MDFDEMAYADTFEINGVSFKGSRDRHKKEVSIPYTDAPTVRIGDVIVQQAGANRIELKVLDVEFLAGGSLEIGTHHPHILNLSVENLTSAAHRTAPAPSAIHIGSMSGHQVQVGSHNSQVVTVSLAEVVKQVAAANDPQAKGLMRQLLENNTVAALLGAGAAGLIAMLGG
ncbi:hypothetical protein [Roseateles sp. P5_D6]